MGAKGRPKNRAGSAVAESRQQKPVDFTLRVPAGVRLRAGGIWVPERRVEQLPPPTAQLFNKPFAWETQLGLLWPTLPHYIPRTKNTRTLVQKRRPDQETGSL